jgi:putative chitinase
MSILTQDQLTSIFPLAARRIAVFYNPLCAAMDEFSITTPLQIAAFIAQIGVESGQFFYVKELSSGDQYEGRVDLGNVDTGDGPKYLGRGLIQITGKANYMAMLMALNIDCIDHPEVVEQPENACRSACWFWSTHNLNELADAGDFETITRRINGGLNGEDQRLAYYVTCKKVLGC